LTDGVENVKGALAYAPDNPELGSIVLRVYPPIASAATSAQTTYTTTTTSVEPYYQNSDGTFTQNPETGSNLKTQYGVPVGYSGPLQPNQVPQDYVGALQPITTTSTTATGSVIKTTLGSFSSTPTEFKYFTGYEYEEDFLTPCDGSNFSVATDQLSDEDRQALVTGARVEVIIDGNAQSISYIDDIDSKGSRSSGSSITVHCRDWMSPAVDCHIDPQTVLLPSMNLLDVLSRVFAPFGMKVVDIDNMANRNSITGRVYGSPTSKKGKNLKSYILHELKPYPQEGAFAFASRISERFGLWLWPGVDGQTIVCGQPDFDQPARYGLRLKKDNLDTGNVLDWDVKISRADQPTIIFASGYGGGGEFAHSQLRGAIINPLVAVGNPQVVNQLLSVYPGIVVTTPPVSAILSGQGIGAQTVMAEPFARPLYLYDSESHDASQLQAYMRRELSLRMRKSLTAEYTIEGHTLGGQPICVDTIIDVDDDVSNIHCPMWIQKRHFAKHGGSQGTTTKITCIRPGTLLF
jgi:prophage tail gpP-like protein